VKFRSYLRLLRIPNVFTSFANVVAGVCLARGGRFEQHDLWIVLASGCLYCAGMVWNDYYDRDIDAEERPERPIPSGEVTPFAAAALGGGLFGLGLALASMHGVLPLICAVLLCTTILLYDASLKAGVLGPWAMGSCRSLNVWLGMSVAQDGLGWLAPLPLVLGLFTVLITQLSRFEVGGTAVARLQATLNGFSGLALIGGLALVGCGLLRSSGPLGWLLAAALFGYVLWRGRSLLVPLRESASPPLLGRAIGGGILLMPAIDAAFVAASGAPLAAAAVLAFIAPAWLLKRWYYLT
jgi:hypothetical protein